MRICWLELSSLAGYSLGAVHTYGVLRLDGASRTESVQIEHRLTTEEVDKVKSQMADGLPEWRYPRAGAMSPSFFGDEAVIERGLEMFREMFDDGNTILCVGDAVYAHPQKAIAGPPETVTMINAWVDRFEAAQSAGNRDAEDRICDEYWEWMHPEKQRE